MDRSAAHSVELFLAGRFSVVCVLTSSIVTLLLVPVPGIAMLISFCTLHDFVITSTAVNTDFSMNYQKRHSKSSIHKKWQGLQGGNLSLQRLEQKMAK